MFGIFIMCLPLCFIPFFYLISLQICDNAKIDPFIAVRIDARVQIK